MLKTDSRVIPGWVYSVYSQSLPCPTLSTNSRRNVCYVGHKIRGNPGLEKVRGPGPLPLDPPLLSDFPFLRL